MWKMSGASAASSRATRALMHEYQGLQKEPLEGFRVRLIHESDLFNWEVAIFGPPGTPYEGGYFKANMKFPKDYPFSPPSLRFISKMYHPNIYDNGDLCISILHPPSADPYSDELACERWNPTQNVRTILISVISLLNEPNISSPANVDAAVMFRRFKEQNDGDYMKHVKEMVKMSRKQADKDGVKVPTTIEDYCVANKKNDVSNNASSATKKGNKSDPTDFSMDDEEFLYDDEDFYEEDDTSEDEFQYSDSDEEAIARACQMTAISDKVSNEKGDKSNCDENCSSTKPLPKVDSAYEAKSSSMEERAKAKLATSSILMKSKSNALHVGGGSSKVSSNDPAGSCPSDEEAMRGFPDSKE